MGGSGHRDRLLRDATGAIADPDAPNAGETYYRQWLTALEAMIAAKGIASMQELSRFQDAWRRAAERTPHGAPIVLADEDL